MRIKARQIELLISVPTINGALTSVNGICDQEPSAPVYVKTEPIQ